MAIENNLLRRLYLEEKLSSAQIAVRLKCSQGQVNYWIRKYNIPKRAIGDATYLRLNPNGDPYKPMVLKNSKDYFLLGLGLGLYWGEGTKRNLVSVRLGNTDPDLVKTFLRFLTRIYSIDHSRLRFGLQIFSDMDVRKEERFWVSFLQVKRQQFYKTIVTKSGSIGTYRQKSLHGVLTIYFHNKKLRDVLNQEIERIREFG